VCIVTNAFAYMAGRVQVPEKPIHTAGRVHNSNLILTLTIDGLLVEMFNSITTVT